jgi:hypothetical protein
MNRTMELTHLAIAEKAVAQGERHIQREEEMIAELDRAGHDTKQALTMCNACDISKTAGSTRGASRSNPESAAAAGR